MKVHKHVNKKPLLTEKQMYIPFNILLATCLMFPWWVPPSTVKNAEVLVVPGSGLWAAARSTFSCSKLIGLKGVRCGRIKNLLTFICVAFGGLSPQEWLHDDAAHIRCSQGKETPIRRSSQISWIVTLTPLSVLDRTWRSWWRRTGRTGRASCSTSLTSTSTLRPDGGRGAGDRPIGGTAAPRLPPRPTECCHLDSSPAHCSTPGTWPRSSPCGGMSEPVVSFLSGTLSAEAHTDNDCSEETRHLFDELQMSTEHLTRNQTDRHFVVMKYISGLVAAWLRQDSQLIFILFLYTSLLTLKELTKWYFFLIISVVNQMLGVWLCSTYAKSSSETPNLLSGRQHAGEAVWNQTLFRCFKEMDRFSYRCLLWTSWRSPLRGFRTDGFE